MVILISGNSLISYLIINQIDKNELHMLTKRTRVCLYVST